jgi:enoyl-CoA hydratase/carnithine racemase
MSTTYKHSSVDGKNRPTVAIERSGPVCVLTLNRPRALNALTLGMLEEFEARLDEVEADAELRTVVLAAAGARAFCVGADLKFMAADPAGGNVNALVDAMHRVFGRIEHFGRPVIAAIHGYCLGGGLELALTADLRIAADGARFGLPEVKVGSLPGGGGTQRLTRLIGPARAKELMFTGDPIDAAEACRIGLVNHVVPAESLVPETMALAGRIATGAPLSLCRIKEVLAGVADREMEEGLQLERRSHDALQDTADRQEGTRAFMEKRTPNFTGR